MKLSKAFLVSLCLLFSWQLLASEKPSQIFEQYLNNEVGVPEVVEVFLASKQTTDTLFDELHAISLEHSEGTAIAVKKLLKIERYLIGIADYHAKKKKSIFWRTGIGLVLIQLGFEIYLSVPSHYVGSGFSESLNGIFMGIVLLGTMIRIGVVSAVSAKGTAFAYEVFANKDEIEIRKIRSVCEKLLQNDVLL